MIGKMDRYIVVSNVEAIEKGYPEVETLQEDYERYQDWFWCLYETDGDQPIRLVGDDCMEPEDASLVRDLRWLVDELNRVAPTP